MSNKPSIPKGTRDFSPTEMARRNYIFDTIKKVYKRYGFQQIETPAMENLSTLIGTGGEESDKLIFKVLDSGDFLKKPKENKLFKENSIAYFNLHIYYSLRIFFQEVISSDGGLQNNLDTVARAIDEQSGFHMYEEIDLLAITTEFLFTHYSYFERTALKFTDRSDSFDFCFNQFYRAHFLQSRLFNDFIERVTKAADGDKEMIGTIEPSQLSGLIAEKALRYDLTVPFARYVVQNQNDITFPFRRFQIQPVWRADRPQKGRYREFYQCDADIIGSDSLLNEVDLIKIIDDVFTELFQDKLNYTISINNRKILQGIVESIGEQDKFEQIVVAIDKYDKIDEDGVMKEFDSIGIKKEDASNLSRLLFSQQLLDITSKFDPNNSITHGQAMLDILSNQLKVSPNGQKGIAELEFIFEKLKVIGYKNPNIKFDPTLARGLGYYTGTIIEVKVDDFPSICGGGRYDDLTGKFGLKDVSGVGISFGADRIYDVLLDNDLYPESIETNSTQVLFYNYGEGEEDTCLKYLFELREAGINAEFYPDTVKQKRQYNFALKKGIRYVITVRSEELKKEVIFMRDMESDTQHIDITIDKAIEIIQNN